MIRKIASFSLLLAVVVGTYFFLRTRVLWLDHFEGVISERFERAFPTVREGRFTQELSEYYWRIQTSDGRTVEAEVPQDKYFRSRPGMKVSKKPFSSEVVLLE